MDVGLEAVFDTVADPIIAADEHGTIVYANAALETLIQCEVGALRGLRVSAIIPERMRVAHEQAYGRSVHAGRSARRPEPLRVPLRRRDGSEAQVEMTLGRIVCHDGRELFVGAMRDLRERVEIERLQTVTRQMRAATDTAAHLTSAIELDVTLRAAVDRLVRDFDAALARIWIHEPDSNVLRLTASAGLSTRVDDSSRAIVKIAEHPYKIGRVARTRKPFLQNGIAGDPEFDREWVAREGLEAVAAIPLLVGDKMEGVLVAFFRTRIEPEIFEVLLTLATAVSASIHGARLYGDLKRAVNARDEVLAIVSHDLRNPLNTIGLCATLCMHASEGNVRENAQRIKSSARRMALLIHDLLDLSALDHGVLKVRPGRESIGSVFDEVLDMFLPNAIEKGIHLSASAEVVPDAVRCDHARIVQVVANLVDNAIKFTPTGGSIAVSAKGDETGVLVTVHDTGIGIPEDALPHVFERYWQVQKGHQGVGLGLAISKGIIEAHGGSIWAESVPGAGSTFSFSIPRVDA